MWGSFWSIRTCVRNELEHAVNANAERIERMIDTSDDVEIDAVYALGRRLFFDRCGPTELYGNWQRAEAHASGG